MMSDRIVVNDEDLDQVVGGLFHFHKSTQSLTYTHQNGTVSDHVCLDFDKAWARVCELEAKNWDEDKIFADILTKKYIAP